MAEKIATKQVGHGEHTINLDIYTTGNALQGTLIACVEETNDGFDVMLSVGDDVARLAAVLEKVIHDVLINFTGEKEIKHGRER